MYIVQFAMSDFIEEFRLTGVIAVRGACSFP